MKREYDSCVAKRDWLHYKTCNACDLHKTCTHENNGGWFSRMIESLIVGIYRWRINRRLRPIFRGRSHQQIKHLLWFSRKAEKKE